MARIFRSQILVKVAIVLLVVASSVLALVRYTMSGARPNEDAYRMAVVQRLTLSNTISATGTLEPCDIIDVGAQVAGRVVEFGTDLDTGKQLDYGSRVTKQMVLARIDPAVYEIEVAIAEAQAKRSNAQLSQAIAQLNEADATIRRNEAELAQQQSRLERSEREWIRAQGLSKSNSISASEIDTIRTDYESLQAAVAVASAAIEQSKCRGDSQRSVIAAAEAETENMKAVLKRARRTLEYCTIVSPIDGIIIDRRVNQGQTVVASLSTPSLFLLATDLQQLEIWVSVNEADIGQIKNGMPVRFTVDSLPEQVFLGSVKQVRLNASMSQNVVTYTVVVSVQNESNLLLPYLTANVEFIVSERSDVLCVPAASLKFNPSEKDIPESELGAGSEQPRVWVVESGRLRKVPVETGVSNGSMVEIQSDILQEGFMVAIGYPIPTSSQASNPFVPRMRSNKRDAKP